MHIQHDFLVIGGGNAGQAAAGVAQRAGLKVALIEAERLGGTCPNRGCVPKKVLVAAAELVDHARRARGHGVEGELRIDWAELQARRSEIVDPIAEGMEKSLSGRGIQLIRGAARFVGPRRVAVGDDTHEGTHVVIATGSIPRPLTMPGHAHVTLSRDALALARVPRSAVFVGAGVVAFELSHVLARAGCERIVLLEVGAHPLKALEADAVQALVKYGAEELGIEVRTGVQVEGVREAQGGFVVDCTRDGAIESIECERVFHGAGRIANLESLDLPSAGLSLERGRPRLEADLRAVDDPAVVVVGDAAPGLPQLSPLATSLGTLVAKNLVQGAHEAPDLRYVPSCVFTIPTLAQVGVTESRAREQGLDLEVRRTEGMQGWISSRTHHESLAFAKVLLEAGTDRIVGAHLIGHGAEANIHLIALAMRAGLSASELGAMDTAYPTYAADLKWLL